MNEPTQDDQDWFDKVQAGYIGLDKPKVTRSVEPHDKYSYQRSKAAKKLGIPEHELADEPDHTEIDDQGWE